MNLDLYFGARTILVYDQSTIYFTPDHVVSSNYEYN